MTGEWKPSAENDAPSVGSLVRAELARRGWTQADLAEVLDRPLQFVNEVCVDKKELTRQSALQIAAALGHTAEWWLRAQDAHRLTFIAQGDALNPIRLRAALARVIPPEGGTP